MGSLYGAMMERIAMVGGEIRGIIWYQGESDALTAGAEQVYEEAFLHLIDSIRSDLGVTELPVIYVQIGRFVHPYGSRAYGWEKIRDIQRRVTSQRKNLYMVSAIDLMLEDAIHVAFEGYQRLGPRLAEIALTEVYHQPNHATPISLDKIEVFALDSRRPMIRVRFNGVNGHLMASGRPAGFELRSMHPAEDPTRFYPQHPTADVPLHVIYRVDFDPNDPAAVILGVFDNSPILLGKPHSLTEPVALVYGGGTDPYVNIVDEKDMPIPAFGPMEVPLHKQMSSGSSSFPRLTSYLRSAS
jgi:sialate O-acetylesterase